MDNAVQAFGSPRSFPNGTILKTLCKNPPGTGPRGAEESARHDR
jgi:hypothetical protein